jgi:predicted nuclease with RNAse H fold
MKAGRQAYASVIGVDLSGPTNTADTAVVRFAVNGRRLSLLEHVPGASDEDLLTCALRAAEHGPVVFGLDAPLSYNPGGGYRPGDLALSRIAVEAGLPPGSVMVPTMTRMAYLTLRGITVARLLETVAPPPRIAEIHPGVTLVLNGAEIEDVRGLKRSAEARQRLLEWLDTQGLEGASALESAGDHLVAACAAAFGAWQWADGRCKWLVPAQPPFHPYDYAC